MIQVFSPSLGKEELAQVADSFNTGWIGKGAKVAAFEAAWARHIGVLPEQVVSTNSCTEALFAAVKLLDIGPGDEVIIPTIHFTGTAQAVIAAGAKPVFCDVDPHSLNITGEWIAKRITPRTKAVILNHYGGVAPEWDDIEFINDYPFGDIAIIEDAACNPLAIPRGDIVCWSFDAMKVLSTGDGGMMAFKDPDLAAQARQWLYLGVTSTGLDGPQDKWWEFSLTQPGARRSIMNDIAAGMGIEQLKKLQIFMARRWEINALYDDLLGDFRGQCGGYFYWLQTPRRDDLARYLRERDIYTTFRYYPLHWAFGTGDNLPNAERAARETLLLPLHCNLTDEDVERICEAVRGFYEG